MKAVIQRVGRASVRTRGRTIAAIRLGLVILLAVVEGDSESQAHSLATKIAHLRIFSDAKGKFNHSLLEVGGQALVVSQFTLVADYRRGRRPSFFKAADPEVAAPLINNFTQSMREEGVDVHTGSFGQSMEVELVNDGPVTLFLDSAEIERLPPKAN